MLQKAFLIVTLCVSTFCQAQTISSLWTAGGCNAFGLVIGSNSGPDGNIHAYTYDLNSDKTTDLGLLNSMIMCYGQSINDHGDAAGTAADVLKARAWIYNRTMDNMRDLGLSDPISISAGTLNPTSSFAFCINNNREVCGQQMTFLGIDDQYMRPMFYSHKTGMIDLGCPTDSTEEGVAYSINNKSVIVGMTRHTSPTTGFPVARATLWVMQKTQTGASVVASCKLLDGFEDAIESSALAINDNRQVVGSFVDSKNNSHAFVWTAKDGMTDLGKLIGDVGAQAQAINQKGVVAGVSYPAKGNARAFVWSEANGMRDLGVQADDDSGLTVVAINNQGMVLINVGNAGKVVAVDSTALK